MSDDALEIETFVSAPFEENAYLVNRPGSHEAFVVDPGFETDPLLRSIKERGLWLGAILNTHGHADHIAGNAALKDVFPDVPLLIGVGDSTMLTDPVANLSRWSGVELVSPAPDHLLSDGQSIELLGLWWDVREIPGHTPGHVVFIWNEGTPPVVFGGDVLFAGGIGRSDFPGGDGPTLVRGIREKLYTLPEETVVYPGHGGPTTIGAEMQHNPFTRLGGPFG
jgi:hydroxyacylglutathione hydrolase